MLGNLQPEDPRSIGRYRLVGRLGEGGMGQVFLGRSPGRRLVAVKVIRPEMGREPAGWPGAPGPETVECAAGGRRAAGHRFRNLPYLYDCYRSPDTGDVIRQSPPAGTHLDRTSPVHLYLQANNCLTVPDVTGMNLSNAAYTLKQAGFTNIPYLYDCYGSTHIGAVVRQSPRAGTSSGKKQPVSLKLRANNC